MIVELPGYVRRYLERRGISRLFPPQREAVEAGLLEGENVLVASPTASGKTLIAEMRIVRDLVEGDAERIVYVVPYRALAREKSEDVREAVAFASEEGGPEGARVTVATGDVREPLRGLPVGVTVTTAEKLDASLRHDPTLASKVDTIVLDEVHLVGDPSRGPTYESLAAAVKASGDPGVLALSATVGNPEELAEWLDARAVVSDWRPVELKGRVHVARSGSPSDRASVALELARENLRRGEGTLVFVYSRRRVEEEALELARSLREGFGSRELAREVLEVSRDETARRLAEAVAKGVGFHHAGLHPEHRALVEDAFREGEIGVVFATPTLAAGVNLPARHVIIQDFGVRIGGEFKPDRNEFQQMAGRAGRPGFDDVGFVHVVASPGSEDVAWDFLHSPPAPVRSALTSGPALRRMLLGFVATGVAGSVGDLEGIFEETLARSSGGLGSDALEGSLNVLEGWGMLERYGSTVSATRLGKVVAWTYVTPDTGHFLRLFLERTGGDPEAVVTGVAFSPDFTAPRIEGNPRSGGQTTLDGFMSGGGVSGSVDLPVEEALEVAFEGFGVEFDAFEVEKREAWASLLLEWIEGRDLDDLVRSYGTFPGDVLAATRDAAWLAWAASRIGSVVGVDVDPWLPERLEHGVPEHLVPLTRVRGVGRKLAERLYREGYERPEDLASASPSELARVEGIGEKRAREIIESAKELVG